MQNSHNSSFCALSPYTTGFERKGTRLWVNSTCHFAICIGWPLQNPRRPATQIAHSLVCACRNQGNLKERNGADRYGLLLLVKVRSLAADSAIGWAPLSAGTFERRQRHLRYSRTRPEQRALKKSAAPSS